MAVMACRGCGEREQARLALVVDGRGYRFFKCPACLTGGAAREPRRADADQRRAVFARDGGRCYACRASLTPDEAQVDHLVPWAAGGTTTMPNLALICAGCNASKQHRPLTVDWLARRMNPSDPRIARGPALARYVTLTRRLKRSERAQARSHSRVAGVAEDG